MHKITAIIPTYNEEQHIAEAIASVAWANEIIVVDSFSTDNTPALVQAYPHVKFIQHPYVNSATQKNWIIPQATHPWVFILDADERVPKPLEEEIIQVIKHPKKTAYWIERRNFFLGKELKHLWKGDRVIRLFQRDLYRYQPLNVHAEIDVKDPTTVGVLTQKLNHYSFKNIRHYLAKIETYAQWSAQDYDAKTPHITALHYLIKPFFRFIKHYFLQKGFLDGPQGLIVSVIMAWGVFLRYVKLYESRQNLG